ncbi:hypothetical protein ACIQM4_03575 [Streptomyces sp. NPDC091272]|uniref:hypothetical protein n=1 Tax=Streptomyces sp. NPDC091272 TaxID=3365981 RepID=UPI00382D37F9
MAGALTDEEIRAAVQREIRKPGVLATSATVEPAHRSRCTVGLLAERREEVPRERRERPKDLAGLQEYEGPLRSVRIDPPTDVRDTGTTRLLRRGSVKEADCPPCRGNGRSRCEDCGGSGRMECPPRVPCKVCEGGPGACTACGGTGRRGRWVPYDEQAQPPKPVREQRPRVRCRMCREPRAACAACQGRGDRACKVCKESGKRTCQDCDAEGTVECPRCKGTGRKVTWTEGHIVRTFGHESLELPLRAPRRRVRKEMEVLGRWSTGVLDDPEATLPDLLDEQHRGALEQFRASRKPAAGRSELLREVELAQLPFYRVTLSTLPHREFYVFAVADGARAVSVLTVQQVRLLSAAAVVAGLLVALVLTLVLR